MKYLDISQDNKTTYVLKENEKCVFFIFNRSGEVSFDLTGIGAEAHIFSFFIGKDTDKHTLHIKQNHFAPKTVSHMLIKSIASDEALCTYEGTIFIDKNAIGSDASQESRALLLSPDALVSMKPSLEILADDVKCHHRATASPLNAEALFFAKTRGLSPAQAKKLLITGFIKSSLDEIKKLVSSDDYERIINSYFPLL